MTSAPTARWFDSRQLRLHVADWGNTAAPPLVLLHGTQDHCRSWDPVAERLRAHWHVFAPDLRGHGDSAWSPEGDYSMAAYVYDLWQCLAQIVGGPAVLVGHSLGGNIATRVAGLYPGLVPRLVSIEGLGLSPAARAEREAQSFAARWRAWADRYHALESQPPRTLGSFEEALERMRLANPSLSASLANHLTRHALAPAPEGRWRWKFDDRVRVSPPVDVTAEQLHGLWHAIECPTLLCYGKDSWASNPAIDGRAQHFRHARVELFAHAGHWVQHDQFEPFVAALEAFLTST